MKVKVRSRAVERIAAGTTAEFQVDAETRRPGNCSASLDRYLELAKLQVEGQTGCENACCSKDISKCECGDYALSTKVCKSISNRRYRCK